MKIIAMYLPQYHRTPENDEWWGEGFTDWVAVKNAEPLFEGHLQPKIPLNEYYYNLLDVKALKWQSELMSKYGIDGICMYHYWFENGRQILEKPAELLHENKDVDMPFCFCWANETWARSWSGLSGANAWSERFEKNSKIEEKVLIRQSYGDESVWRKHFEYLVKFFQDERYIRIDDKPLFLIYKADFIPRLEEMILCWRKMANDAGFKDIYVIAGDAEMIPDNIINGRIVKEPSSEYWKVPVNRNGIVGTRKYKELWDSILDNETNDEMAYYAGFVKYDDTPRRGKAGVVVTDASPELFEEYLYKLMKKNSVNNKEITFINAWNEWGEGMYLEPDEEDGYSYLEGVKNAKKRFLSDEEYITHQAHHRRIPKDTLYLRTLHRWMSLREQGKTILDFFNGNDIKKIVIYGYSIFAKHLICELSNSGVDICCIIDKMPTDTGNIPCLTPYSDIPDSDAVIVCSFYNYKEIYSMLKSINTFSESKIYSINAIINGAV